MALSNSTLNLLRTQYYDDYYNQSNTDPSMLAGVENDYLRILFRPRYAVQSRELTQLQTLLQAQLERLGRTSFRDGSVVLSGGITLDTGVISGKVLPTTNLVAFFDRTTNSGKYIFDKSAVTTKAHVLQFLSAEEGTTPDNYLVFKYQGADTFLPGTVVQDVDDVTATATFAAGAAGDVFTGGSVVSIDEGVLFVSGFFVRVAKQTIVLNAFSTKPTYRVGVEVTEQVVDELDDVLGESLLDPANSGAPGAHRFRITLKLAKRGIAVPADTNFIELVRVIDGVIQYTKTENEKYVRLKELNQILARRTYDEAGDYIVRNFTPVIEANPTDANTFNLSLGPGKAYVRGYEIETTEPTKKAIRKGRVTETASNRSIPLAVGSFIYATRVQATTPLSYFANTTTVDIHCVNVASIDTSTTGSYNRSRIGTAKVRMLETLEVPADISLAANNSVYKLYFYDVAFDALTGNVGTASVVNNAIQITLPIANGVPNINAAIEGATIVMYGASSPISGTFTVNNYSSNATFGLITLREFLPTLPNGNTTCKLLFQLKDIDAFAIYDAAVASINPPYLAKFAFQADIHLMSKFGGLPTSPTVVESLNDNVLLYQIPEKFVKANTITTNTAAFESWVKTTANARSMGGASNTDFTVTVAGDNISLPVGTISAALAQEFLIIFDQTNDANGHGEIIQFSDSPGSARAIANVSIATAGANYNITFNYHNGSGSGTTRSFVGLARAHVIGKPTRTKTLMLGNTTAVLSGTTGALDAGQIEFYSLNAVAGFAYSLKTTDVMRIAKVLYKEANTAFANGDLSTATDVTDLFTLDTGQRDNTYEYGHLVVGSRASNIVHPGGRLLVIFDWFKHAGAGYVTLDSYLSSTNVSRGMTYDDIPAYTSAKYKRTVNLRDVIDFRPARSHQEFAAASLIFAANDAQTNTTYLTSADEAYLIPVSDDVWIGSYEYYLGRIDKIGLDFDGVFKVIEGQDAVSPVAPTSDGGCLLLFQLRIPPYTLVNDNSVPTSVLLTTFEHKRFTMADLAKVEDRISHLEYYTALNSLERITRDQSILDADNNERFKNGILVDSFHGGDVGDVTRVDFTASIDAMNRELRTAFRSFVTQFAPDTANATSYNVTLIGDMAIPTYNTAAMITQPLATHAISVNPFDVGSFYGTVTLSPAVDIWKDVQTKPAQVIDLGGPSESWINANLPSFTNWGEWDQTWSGVVSSNTRRQYFTPEGWTPDDHGFRSMTELSWNDVTTATVYERQGTAYEYTVTPTSESVGNMIRDVSIVHNMRARDIVFCATGLKPASNIYAFFDGVNITKYIQQATVLQLEETTVSSRVPFFVGQTVFVSKPISGRVATAIGNNTITGSNTVYQFELVLGQRVRITQGVNTFDTFITEISSNTQAKLNVAAGITLANATLSTMTPVTVADIASRITGNNVQYTIKVNRSWRDADLDRVRPYDIIGGSLRPDKHVSDVANTTVGAMVIIPSSPRMRPDVVSNPVVATINIASAICKSGVVRNYTHDTAQLRFDLDISDSVANVVGTTVHFVAGPGAGTSANIVSYTAATQTAVLDNSALEIVTNQTIYTLGNLTTDGFIANSSVISGRAGTIAGVFHLPDGMFAVGTRLFRLTDQANNVIKDATTTAETNYTASGMSYTQQDVSVSSRQLGLRRMGPRSETMTFTSTSTSDAQIAYVDPLAETFLVDAKLYPQGVFVTSIDLCFATVPVDDIPVTVEIRPVVNGYPASGQIVPCVCGEGLATSTLRPDQVITSASPDIDSAQTRTTFKMPAPVHLLPGKEYAIVIRSDSDVYTVYTAVLGETIIGSDAKVAKQPYAGSFFKSQNASTWTESPFEDLMFRINKAVWNASEAAPYTGMLVARAISPDTNTSFDSIEFYPHEVQFSDFTWTEYTLDILPVNANTGDLTDSIAIRYAVLPNAWTPLARRSMMQGATDVDDEFTGPSLNAANTIEAMITLVTTSADVAPFVDLKKINMLGVRHLINDMGLQADDIMTVNPGAGYLPALANGKITTNGTTLVTGDANCAFTNTVVGCTLVIGGNLEFVVASVTNAAAVLATANVVARTANAFYTYGTPGGNNTVAIAITDTTGADAAGYATIGKNGKVSGFVLTSNGSGYIGTPAVTMAAPAGVGGYTLTQTGAVLAYNSELAPLGGNALTRYITRAVTLADGFDARDIKVLFDAYRPLGSKFYVYYKVLPGDADTVRFDDQPWRMMEQETADNVICTSYNQYKEFSFKTPNDRALDSTTDNTDKFKVFAVKVVMASSGTVDAPRIANFRAIALDQ